LAESRGKEVCWATFAAEVQVQGVHSHRGKGSKRSRTCRRRRKGRRKTAEAIALQVGVEEMRRPSPMLWRLVILGM